VRGASGAVRRGFHGGRKDLCYPLSVRHSLSCHFRKLDDGRLHARLRSAGATSNRVHENGNKRCVGEGGARGRVLYPDSVAGASRRKNSMVGHVGEGGPRARVPDQGARNRLAYEMTGRSTIPDVFHP
jgi:hypothetical protein